MRLTNYLLTSLFICLLAAALGYYGLIHWRVIWMAEPVALREPAVIIDMRGYLDPGAPRPYTLESLPEYTNLYGIGYIWMAAPFARWLPFSEYSNLRLANTCFLGLLLIVIGIGSAAAGWRARSFLLVMVYCIFVRSTSMAASPDILGCLLYTASWVMAIRGQFRWAWLVCSVAVGILGFLTKPYYLLGIGGLGSYLFLFRSKRTGLLYLGGAVTAFGIVGLIINYYFPYYFASVVEVHAATTTTRIFDHGLRQWGEFIALVPVPCYFAAKALVRGFGKGLKEVSDTFADSVIRQNPPAAAYGWGAGVATAALAVSLSWHGGAYLTYFWHLLLPLLALWLAESKQENRAVPFFYCVNIVTLLTLAPSLPKREPSPDWLILQSAVRELKNPYIDPYFEVFRAAKGHPIPDNGQSEYLLYAASMSSNSSLRKMSRDFIEGYIRKLFEQRYDALILVEQSYFHELVIEQVNQNYQLVANYKVSPYYNAFRKPSRFGIDDSRVLIFLPKSRSDTVSFANMDYKNSVERNIPSVQ